jgi:hypothetical protein
MTSGESAAAKLAVVAGIPAGTAAEPQTFEGRLGLRAHGSLPAGGRAHG